MIANFQFLHIYTARYTAAFAFVSTTRYVD
jgi:hypothetical protein